jgi:predicted neuraminidase
MAYLRGTPRMLPNQPVPTVDPEVERLAHVVVDGLIARLAAEPAVPATSLLDNLADQLQQAATLRRLYVVRRNPGSGSATSLPATPRRIASQHP